MKKLIIRVISYVLIVSLISCSIGLTASAQENVETVYEEVMIFDDVTIVMQEDSDGNITISEYKSGILTQKNRITCDMNGVIIREFYDNNQSKASYSDRIYVNDVVELACSDMAVPCIDTSYSLWGHIEYRVTVTEGSIYYMQAVRLNISGPVTTTYTIRSWVGTVVDLMSILASAGLASLRALSSFVPALLTALGITVIGGAITQALSTTVASRQTTYTWQVYDVHVQIPTYLVGTQNYIIDETSHYAETYTDGILPSHWGTTTMSVTFYNSSYFESAWTVSRWLMDPNSGFM